MSPFSVPAGSESLASGQCTVVVVVVRGKNGFKANIIIIMMTREGNSGITDEQVFDDVLLTLSNQPTS